MGGDGGKKTAKKAFLPPDESLGDFPLSRHCERSEAIQEAVFSGLPHPFGVRSRDAVVIPEPRLTEPLVRF